MGVLCAARVGEAPMPQSRAAQFVEKDLRALIAGVLSRPYRAFLGSRSLQVPVSDEVSRTALRTEIDALPSDQRLVDSGKLHVYYAHAGQIPWILQEIGRLRELTFRAAGEGTGKRSDIDLFDSYYLHLFVWDADAGAIAGAYRLGLVDEILAHYGKRGLYTHSLFRYGARALESLNPAIELGRSFVRAEYQRSFAALLLLWIGIARFVERAPQYAVLFGAVSISNSYAPTSRRLIVEYLSTHRSEARLASQIRSRRPYRIGTGSVTVGAAASAPKNIDELSRVIEKIEQDGKGVPILLKQYLRLGGKLLGFNLDAAFGNTLDGLIMVDLRQVEPNVLARYMGKAGAAAFYAYHANQSTRRRAS